MANNQIMEISQSQLEAIESALREMETLDPAELPEPAAQLADLLGSILEDQEQS